MKSKLCVSCDECSGLLDGVEECECECGNLAYSGNVVYCDTNDFTIFEVFVNEHGKIIRMLIKEEVKENVKCKSIR